MYNTLWYAWYTLPRTHTHKLLKCLTSLRSDTRYASFSVDQTDVHVMAMIVYPPLMKLGPGNPPNSMGVSINGDPQNGSIWAWFTRENPLKMNDDLVVPPWLRKALELLESHGKINQMGVSEFPRQWDPTLELTEAETRRAPVAFFPGPRGLEGASPDRFFGKKKAGAKICTNDLDNS